MTPPAPPGAVAIAVASAAWIDRVRVAVGVVLTNGAGGAPAPQDPSLFRLETAQGAVVTHTLGSPTTCSSAISVAAGASLECALVFEVPVDHEPTRLHYETPDGRMASAPIAQCAPATPNGLCPFDSICDGGSCVPSCSVDNPTGRCADPDTLCERGHCVPRCSPSVPYGACEVGACVDGHCDPSCRRLDLVSECYACLEPAYTACLGGEDTCYDTYECANCVVGGSSICECAEEYVCRGCEAQIRAVVDCIAQICPACVR